MDALGEGASVRRWLTVSSIQFSPSSTHARSTSSLATMRSYGMLTSHIHVPPGSDRSNPSTSFGEIFGSLLGSGRLNVTVRLNTGGFNIPEGDLLEWGVGGLGYWIPIWRIDDGPVHGISWDLCERAR